MSQTKASKRLRSVLMPKPELTAEDLARRIGVSRTTVYEWAAGKIRPDPKRMALVEEMLGIPMRDWTVAYACQHVRSKATSEPGIEHRECSDCGHRWRVVDDPERP